MQTPKGTIRNLPAMLQRDPQLGESFRDVQDHVGNLSRQLGADPNGANVVPPQIGGIAVSVSSQGFVDVAITDNGKIARGINYFVEIATNAGFQGSRIYPLGPSRNFDKILPNGTYWIRAYSQYPAGGPPSAAVAYPNPVTIASSAVGTATLLGSQGAGTGGGGAGTNVTR